MNKILCLRLISTLFFGFALLGIAAFLHYGPGNLYGWRFDWFFYSAVFGFLGLLGHIVCDMADEIHYIKLFKT